MTTKAKAAQNRNRIIRSAILTASMLSIVPLVGLMQEGHGSSTVDLTASLDTMAAQTDLDTAVAPAASSVATTSALEPVSMSTTSVSTSPTNEAASAAAATTSKSTTNQTTTSAGYTRTKAS